MKNYTNTATVVSFFALWLVSFFSANYQIIAGFVLILTFGILHGSNDLGLLDKITTGNNNTSKLRVTIYYVLFILIGFVLFYLIPLLALITFILVSSYHFGEQQWQELPPTVQSWLIHLYQFLSGFIILLLIFVFHQKQVQEIIFLITNYSIPVEFFPSLLFAFGLVLICLIAYFYWKVKLQRTEILLQFFRLLIFTIIFKTSSLIWGFAIYFVIWHSIPSIIDQIKFLHGSVSRGNLLMYCNQAGLNWLISVISVFVLYYFFSEEQVFNAIFFSFLAAITFPHAVVITTMFRDKKS
jgi:Brp/Blh family beta-carotene 15,15'-monooxygenase